jgi:hypothetical protein
VAVAVAMTAVAVLKNASIVTLDGVMWVFVWNGAMVLEGEKVVAIGKAGEVLKLYESKVNSVLNLSFHRILNGMSHLQLLHFSFSVLFVLVE